jgi:hypothetical protein
MLAKEFVSFDLSLAQSSADASVEEAKMPNGNAWLRRAAIVGPKN